MKSRRIPKIPEEERTPTVLSLCELIELLKEDNQRLQAEIDRLNGEKPKKAPNSSSLEGSERGGKKGKGKSEEKKRPGSEKRSKTKDLKINRVEVIKPDEVPEGSEFKGYHEFTVQELIITTRNTLYRLERWKTPDGTEVVGKLPDGIAIGHFGTTLVAFILYLYYQLHATQPLILEGLSEWGVDISAGQVSRIITEGKDRFHKEKDEILRVGLMVSRYVHVDDTGAMHQGVRGWATHIGNEMFAWYESTDSKSRINFFTLLCARDVKYVLNEDALSYMKAQKLPKYLLELLGNQQGLTFPSEDQWEAALLDWGITKAQHKRTATEGALLGCIIDHGVSPGLTIISDDAGQFNVFVHALCWIHAERTLQKLEGFNDKQKEALEEVRNQIWDLYQVLKMYKEDPKENKKAEIEERFDEIFTQKTCYISLNFALTRLHLNKSELLLVLERPETPLHNNPSESDIREYVKKRKVSGSTRSKAGRRCRDTFTSLKKTCRKQGISFWDYLKDRLSNTALIPQLPDLISEQAHAPP
jgi:hypothetical protein